MTEKSRETGETAEKASRRRVIDYALRRFGTSH